MRIEATGQLAALFSSALLACTTAGLAAEGASSNYFPGAYGSLLPGVAPEPGGVLADLNLYYNAKASRAVLQGAANLSVEVEAYYNLIQGLYVWDTAAIGGRFAVGGYVPVGYASLGASIGALSVSGDEVGLGDIGIIPASFYWNSGNFHLNLYELVIAPTGDYSTSEAVNVGRNYWSFDTVAAVTWFNPESGTEISIVPGIMINTRNKATDYHTGTELHVDAMVNQFLSETFALGVHGYAYRQVEGDSGSGAILGSFKGESAGIGLAISWIPAAGGGNVAISGKWLHDLTATNRLEADYGVLSVGITF